MGGLFSLFVKKLSVGFVTAAIFSLLVSSPAFAATNVSPTCVHSMQELIEKNRANTTGETSQKDIWKEVRDEMIKKGYPPETIASAQVFARLAPLFENGIVDKAIADELAAAGKTRWSRDITFHLKKFVTFEPKYQIAATISIFERISTILGEATEINIHTARSVEAYAAQYGMTLDSFRVFKDEWKKFENKEEIIPIILSRLLGGGDKLIKDVKSQAGVWQGVRRVWLHFGTKNINGDSHLVLDGQRQKVKQSGVLLPQVKKSKATSMTITEEPRADVGNYSVYGLATGEIFAYSNRSILQEYMTDASPEEVSLFFINRFKLLTTRQLQVGIGILEQRNDVAPELLDFLRSRLELMERISLHTVKLRYGQQSIFTEDALEQINIPVDLSPLEAIVKKLQPHTIFSLRYRYIGDLRGKAYEIISADPRRITPEIFMQIVELMIYGIHGYLPNGPKRYQWSEIEETFLKIRKLAEKTNMTPGQLLEVRGLLRNMLDLAKPDVASSEMYRIEGHMIYLGGKEVTSSVNFQPTSIDLTLQSELTQFISQADQMQAPTELLAKPVQVPIQEVNIHIQETSKTITPTARVRILKPKLSEAGRARKEATQQLQERLKSTGGVSPQEVERTRAQVRQNQ